MNKDPWSYLQLITSINLIKENIPGSIVSVYPGGRNWLPIVTLGILMGVDIVRVGVEDCYWMYPHKNERRRVVTDPKEARKILGMKLTSKL